jgi:hypothetical protein
LGLGFGDLLGLVEPSLGSRTSVMSSNSPSWSQSSRPLAWAASQPSTALSSYQTSTWWCTSSVSITSFKHTSGSPPRTSAVALSTWSAWTGDQLCGIFRGSSCLKGGCWAGLLLAGPGLVSFLSMGAIGLTNLLFLMVTRLLLSTLIITLQLGLFSRTMPVLSYLVGLVPV